MEFDFEPTPTTESVIIRKMEEIGRCQGNRLLDGNWTPWVRLQQAHGDDRVEIRAQVHRTCARYTNPTMQIRMKDNREDVMTLSYVMFFEVMLALGEWANCGFRDMKRRIEDKRIPGLFDSLCYVESNHTCVRMDVVL